MRFLIMHRTEPRWEADEVPSPELIATVGAMVDEMVKAEVLLGAEGLRASAHGARLKREGGAWSVTAGPFEGDNELPAGFTLLRAASLEDAVAWARRLGDAHGDVEIDVRPINEPWDIGMVPPPEDLSRRRYMALRKATPATEAGSPPPATVRAAVDRLRSEMERDGVHLGSETLRPSRRGRRYKNSADGLRVMDGPFAESKELLGGYVIVAADSLEAADRWARRYVVAVGAREVDVRELEEPTT